MRSYYVTIQQRVDGEDTTESRDVEFDVTRGESYERDVSCGVADVEQMVTDMEQEAQMHEVCDENMGRLGRLAGYLLGSSAALLTAAHDGPNLSEDDIEYDPQEGEAEFVLNTPEGEVRFTLKLEEPAEVVA